MPGLAARDRTRAACWTAWPCDRTGGRPNGRPRAHPGGLPRTPRVKIPAQTSRIAARALASGGWIRTIVRMDENPGTPPPRGELRCRARGHLWRRATGRAASRAGGCDGRPAGRRARGERRPAPACGRRLRDRRRTGGPPHATQGGPWRVRALAFLMTVRLADGSPFTEQARRADPGPVSRSRTSGPSRGDRRPGSVLGVNGRRSGRLVRMAGCAKRRRKMLLNLRLSFFGRKNLAQPSLARMLAWNPTQLFWPRTMVRTQRIYRALARPLSGRRDPEGSATAVERAF
jgi:hypothetical protein